jgi:thiamine-phosphate pyrophosphorylase
MQLPRLIALTPGDLAPASAARFLRAFERALAAGLPGLLVREPGLGDRAYLELVRELRVRQGERELWLGLHDRAHLVRAAGAAALHLGFRSLPCELLRPWLGPGPALGLSTHAGDDPRPWEAADYLFHGPLHETPSKHGRLAPVGLAGLARALRASSRPLLALGGVRPQDVGPALAAGAHGVAVRAGILGARDPGAAAAAYLQALEESR